MRTTSVLVPGTPARIEFALHADHDKHVSESIAEHGVWEPFETDVIRALLPSVDRFVDCGANIGWYSILAAAHGVETVAFEPHPANADLLDYTRRANAAILLAPIELHRVALGSAESTAVLELAEENQGDHRVVQRPHGKRRTVEVAVQTLDAVLSGRRAELLKLDTQGSEVAILRGAGKTLGSVGDCPPPSLVIEFWPYGLRHCGAHEDGLLDIFDSLLQRGHVAFEIQEWRRALRPCDIDDLRNMAAAPGFRAEDRGFTNLLLTNEAHTRALRESHIIQH